MYPIYLITFWKCVALAYQITQIHLFPFNF